jgi:hypothetical protein
MGSNAAAAGAAADAVAAALAVAAGEELPLAGGECRSQPGR